MSQNLFLIEYTSSNDGKLYESNAEVIGSCFINNYYIELFEKNSFFDNVRLYEDVSSNDYTLIKIINCENLRDIFIKLEKEFFYLIDTTVNKNSDENIIFSDKDTMDKMDKFRILTNIEYLFRIKKEKYIDDKFVIKIGWVMSDNKGKDGELKTTIILSAAAIREDGLEVMRPTSTNQSDLGADIILKGKRNTFKKLFKIASAVVPNNDNEPNNNDDEIAEARIDVKATKEKLTGDTVDKFASDVRKHPNTDTHILLGGKGLTKSAQNKLNEHVDAFKTSGKNLVYISNAGLEKIARHYKSEIKGVLPNDNQQDEEE